jgi:hypothetical protein
MTKKLKTFHNFTFPFETIEDSFEVFKSLLLGDHTINFSKYRIGYKDESMELDLEQFIIEYRRREFTSASIHIMGRLNDSRFQIEFYLYVNESGTDISIALPRISDIDKVLYCFEENYKSQEENLTSKGFNLRKPKYSIEQKIISLNVNKELIQKLEDYIIQRVCSLAGLNSLQAYEDFNIYIYCSKSGDRSVQTIKDYQKQLFPDDISSITLRYDSNYSNGISILVRLSTIPSLSKFEISYRGDDAQEIVDGISSSFKDKLKDFKNNNFLFNPSMEFRIFLTLIVLGLIVIIFNIEIQDLRIKNSIITFLYLTSVYSLGFFLKPYSVFDSRKNSKLAYIKKYFLEIILGGILVSLLTPWISSLF